MISAGRIVSSHQPHFFPWLGYYDKMAKADLFLVNDIAQLERQSPMVRNKILDRMGCEHFINVIVDKTDYLKKENREIFLKDWESCRKSITGKIRDCYRRAEYFEEIWPLFSDVLNKDYEKLIELQISSIEFGRKCLAIETPMLFQSGICFESGSTTSERLANKLKAVEAQYYLSGNGAKQYMQDSDFTSRGIEVIYQRFSYPVYQQVYGGEFVSNLSVIDLVFNCGIDKSREVFWNNVKISKEVESIKISKAGFFLSQKNL